MINAQYKLTSPMTITPFYKNLDYTSKNVIVKPKKLSICKADIRYYFGMRDAKILRKRLPLALIHEACGTVLNDPTGELKKGDKVILLPNIPGKEEKYLENYREDSLFRSSRADGFMQELLSLPSAQLVKYNDIDENCAAFVEFISVGVHAVSSYVNLLKDEPERIAVWGDGALGYIICCLLKVYLPKTHITSVGVVKNKSGMFKFVDECLSIDEVTSDLRFDDVFECVGGAASGNAISQMIDTINPEGHMMLLGVSEEPVPVNTRMVLEKGLTLIGRSRSGRKDFEESVRILETDKKFASRMKLLVSDEINVKSISDIHKAFNQSKIVDYKVVLNWMM